MASLRPLPSRKVVGALRALGSDGENGVSQFRPTIPSEIADSPSPGARALVGGVRFWLHPSRVEAR